MVDFQATFRQVVDSKLVEGSKQEVAVRVAAVVRVLVAHLAEVQHQVPSPCSVSGISNSFLFMNIIKIYIKID